MSIGNGAIGVSSITGTAGQSATAASGLVATSTAAGIVLAWTPGTGAAAQRVERQSTADLLWSPVSGLEALSATATGAIDTSVSANILYAYRVVNLDAGGAAGVASAAAQALAYPVLITDLAGSSPTPTQVTLTWTAPSVGLADSQRVERAALDDDVWTVLAAPGPAVGAYADSTIEPGEAYRYRVVTVNAAGERASAPVTVASAAPPAIPRGTFGAPRRLQVLIRTAPRAAGGAVVADLSPWVTSATISRDARGDRDARVEVARPLPQALLLYLRRGALTLEVCAGDQVIWEGTITEPSLVVETRAGFAATALGPWASLGDLRVTGVWSDSDLQRWREVSSVDRFNRTPRRYDFSQDGELYTGLKSGVTYASNRIGSWMYQLPAGCATRLSRLELTITILLPTTMSVGIARLTGGPGGAYTQLEAFVGTGAVIGPLTRVYDFGGPVADTLLIELVPLAEVTYTGSDGDHFVAVAAARVRGGVSGAAGATLDPAQIARDLVTIADERNPGHLAQSTSLIASTGVDRRDAVYEDAAPGDILDGLATEGAGAGPWAVGVDSSRRLYLRPRASAGRAWSVRATQLELAQRRADVRNAIYAVYEDSRGITRRTATAVDAGSVARYGVRREGVVRSDGSTLAQAERARNAALAEQASPPPQAGWTFRQLRTPTGALVPGWMARPGDTITETSLSAGYDGALDRLRTFRIAETTYDLISGELAVVPESPLPSVERLLAE